MSGAVEDEGRKIGQVVAQTGLSKELIHHYLRQGLLPPSPSRARYDERQIRLLGLIKRLREEHHLPLEVIRGFFEALDHDPARIEPLLLVESLSQRIAQLAGEPDLALSRTLSTEELAAAAGVAVETVSDYIEQGLIAPLDEPGPRFSPYDANVIALCERALVQGIPFESFRTIASYVRVAFEIEHSEFFDVSRVARPGAPERLEELFLRRELVSSFVLNVFQSMTQRYLRDMLERPAPRRPGLDAVVYRPSAAFIRRHGLDERIEALRAKLGQGSDEPRVWLELAELELHAGGYHEAAFFLEQALDRWPGDDTLRTHHGLALVLSGEGDKGRRVLERVLSGTQGSALARVNLGLALLARASPSGELDARDAARILSLVREALPEADEAGPYRVHVRMFGAWLLTALPPAFRRLEEGLRALKEVLERLRASESLREPFPGLRQRYLINAAYLLFECLSRTPAPAREAIAGLPSAEELRVLICRGDPASIFAREVYLTEVEP